MSVTKKEVNEILKGSWTPKGVRQWWDRPRYQLHGRTPNEYWEIDPQAVYDLAFDAQWGGGT